MGKTTENEKRLPNGVEGFGYARVMLNHHNRYPYSAIIDRPDFGWPEGRRLALYIAVNLECFAFGEGAGATLTPEKPQPDVLNYAWRDYGNRVVADVRPLR